MKISDSYIAITPPIPIRPMTFMKYIPAGFYFKTKIVPVLGSTLIRSVDALRKVGGEA